MAENTKERREKRKPPPEYVGEIEIRLQRAIYREIWDLQNEATTRKFGGALDSTKQPRMRGLDWENAAKGGIQELGKFGWRRAERSFSDLLSGFRVDNGRWVGGFL